jgi:hypothetical protein
MPSVQCYNSIVKNDACDIYVMRIDRNGHIRCARPCMECLKTLQRTRIQHVVYSTQNGEFECEPIATMTSTHVTSFFGFVRITPHNKNCKAIFTKKTVANAYMFNFLF